MLQPGITTESPSCLNGSEFNYTKALGMFLDKNLKKKGYH